MGATNILLELKRTLKLATKAFFLVLVIGITALTASFLVAMLRANAFFGRYANTMEWSAPKPCLMTPSADRRAFWCATYCGDDPLGCCFPPHYYVSFLGRPAGVDHSDLLARMRESSRARTALEDACHARVRQGEDVGRLVGDERQESYFYEANDERRSLTFFEHGVAVTNVDSLSPRRPPYQRGVVACWGVRSETLWVDDGTRREFRRVQQGLLEVATKHVYRSARRAP